MSIVKFERPTPRGTLEIPALIRVGDHWEAVAKETASGPAKVSITLPPDHAACVEIASAKVLAAVKSRPHNIFLEVTRSKTQTTIRPVRYEVTEMGLLVTKLTPAMFGALLTRMFRFVVVDGTEEETIPMPRYLVGDILAQPLGTLLDSFPEAKYNQGVLQNAALFSAVREVFKAYPGPNHSRTFRVVELLGEVEPYRPARVQFPSTDEVLSTILNKYRKEIKELFGVHLTPLKHEVSGNFWEGYYQAEGDVIATPQSPSAANPNPTATSKPPESGPSDLFSELDANGKEARS